tara:strand:- start:19438 stop:19833 length:396 start_codon:yes stop_codon:yes gene_type:complete
MAWVIVALATTGACGREDDRPATFTYVYETVIAANCATIGCHNKVSQTYGLQFETKAGAYAGLTGRACDEGDDIPGEAAANYVRPGDPDRSQLISLLYGDDVPRRMPPDRGLSEVDIELVERWILEGALCN